VTGFALRKIQSGKDHPDAKPMKGPLRDVIEITVDDASGERSIERPAQPKSVTLSVKVIRERLKTARKHYEEYYAQEKR